MKKFSEIAKDDIHLAGEKMSLQDIVGKSIIPSWSYCNL